MKKVSFIACLVACVAITSEAKSLKIETSKVQIPLIEAGKEVSCKNLSLDQCAVKVVKQSKYFADLLKGNGIDQLSQPINVMTIHEFGDAYDLWTQHIVAINLGEDSYSNIQLYRVKLSLYIDEKNETDTFATDASEMAPVVLQETVPVLGLNMELLQKLNK